MEKGLGRVYIPDERDWILAAATEPARKPRKSPFYRTGPTLDQGAQPACVGFMWRQWLSSAHLMTKSGPAAFDIYKAAQKLDPWPGENYAGTSVRAGALHLRNVGLLDYFVFAALIEDVRDWHLDGYGTACFGINWHRGMWEPDERGYIHPTGSIDGGHAILSVGYSKKRDAFRLLNSWGPRWGQENGRCWLDRTDAAGLLAAYGEVCLAVERKP